MTGFLSLLKRPLNCVRVLLTNGLWMLMWILHRKSKVWLMQTDPAWPEELSLLKEARTHKTFNWLPVAYWKCCVWPDNIVLQKAILGRLLQLLGLSQMNMRIHPVKQTFFSENYICEINLCQNATFSGSTEQKALLRLTSFKKKWMKPGQMEESDSNKAKETSGEYAQLCLSG